MAAFGGLVLGIVKSARKPGAIRLTATSPVMTTVLDPDELVTEVRIPMPPLHTGGAYEKLERKVGDYAQAVRVEAERARTEVEEQQRVIGQVRYG